LKNPDTREPRSFKQRKESLPSGIISRRHIDNWRKSGMELSEYLFEIIVSLSEYKIRCQNRRSNRTETSNQVKYATCCLIFFSEPEYCALSLTVDSTHHSHLLAAFLKVVLIDAYCIDPSKKARQVAAHTAPVHVTARGLSKLDHRKPLWSPGPLFDSLSTPFYSGLLLPYSFPSLPSLPSLPALSYFVLFLSAPLCTYKAPLSVPVLHAAKFRTSGFVVTLADRISK
jgi:hypothetical protein